MKSGKSEHAAIGSWQFVLNYMLHKIQPKKNDGIRDIQVIVDQRSQLSEIDIDLDASKLASLSFRMGSYTSAITLWEDMDVTKRPPEYYRAKLKMLKYPATIEFYEGTGDKDWKEQVIREFRKSQIVNLKFRKRV